MKDDTISRQAVLKLLSTMPPEEAMTKAMLIQSVKQMDAAQPSGPDNLVKDSQGLVKDLVNDCISRQAAIDAVKGRYYKYDRFAKVEELVWAIEALPPEQPEIIRCRDCYYRLGRYCHYRYTTGLFISADHYCGFAKRQEDNK